MNELDLSILKYYKEGGELCGFEKGAPWTDLEKNNYLDGDLELTKKGWEFIKSYKNWDKVVSYNNETRITIKPKLS